MAAPLRESDDDDLAEQHEINVTPFIDVILVLLIVFMVAAPLSTVDIAVELPVSTAKPQPRPEKPVFVTIKADNTLAVGEDAVSGAGLIGAIDAATSSNREARLFLRADKSVAYGELMRVMDLLRTGGYLKVGLVGLEAGASAGPSETAPAKETR
jgi:biopolymer transport protein ExbD